MKYDKETYVRSLMRTVPVNPKLMEAAIIFYHSDIPLIDALMYIKNLSIKLMKIK